MVQHLVTLINEFYIMGILRTNATLLHHPDAFNGKILGIRSKAEESYKFIDICVNHLIKL